MEEDDDGLAEWLDIGRNVRDVGFAIVSSSAATASTDPDTVDEELADALAVGSRGSGNGAVLVQDCIAQAAHAREFRSKRKQEEAVVEMSSKLAKTEASLAMVAHVVPGMYKRGEH